MSAGRTRSSRQTVTATPTATIMTTRPILQSTGSMLLNSMARRGGRRSPPACGRAGAAAGWAVRVAGGAGRRADRGGGGAVNAGAAVMGTSVPIAAPPNHQATPRKGLVLAIRVIPSTGPENPVDARAGDGRSAAAPGPGGREVVTSSSPKTRPPRAPDLQERRGGAVSEGRHATCAHAGTTVPRPRSTRPNGDERIGRLDEVVHDLCRRQDVVHERA